ncbi:endoglucanase [Capronia coronata CBS 617.96]|uniref:Endoglucanase n=1 Tax=Capronia coronata CBS 617.96 TaxID=1182541 RepID=W9YXP0_9EURO|nr:endoglucanase [Capronia coronata CBS 617.96]EXJ94430.1 endoglucanase [Capronia coronata CBS 617.96]
MSLIKSTALLGALALISKVSAHGTVQGIVAGGVWYSGYSPLFQYQYPPPVVAGWSIPEDINNGFVSDYTSPDIICHKGATPGGAYVSVAAGDTVELQWTVWPESHKGPMLDYLASCGDDCTTVDKTKLLFNKIDESGLIDGSTPPGHWASDDMIANNNSWVVTIPSSIAPGKYVLRHETIALHVAKDVNSAQNYPQCINLEVTGSGSNSLSTGTLGTDLYTAQDPGILINIYQVLTSYIIPGPPLLDGSSSGAQPSVSASATASAAASSAVDAISTTSSASVSSTAFFSNSTMTSTGISITATPSKPAAVVTPSAVAGGSSEAVTSAPAPEPTAVDSPAPAETEPATVASSASASSEIAATGTSPVSFSSIVTGRIGKPTKFICYLEE